tara:strand:+ start:92 stop:484 length:393 start_codon:yes stop_codon:yes gene_type:complete
MGKGKDKPKKKGPGRPKVNIDFDNLDQLLALQCTLEEVAFFFNVSPDTVQRRIRSLKKLTFSQYFKLRSAGGQTSIRRQQFAEALNGSVPMLIWLGKQYLGQADKKETEITELKPIRVLDLAEEILSNSN